LRIAFDSPKTCASFDELEIETSKLTHVLPESGRNHAS